MKRNGFIIFTVALTAIVLMMGPVYSNFASAAEKKVIKLKMGAGHPLAANWVRFAKDFFIPEVEKRVAARTNYQVEIAEFWAGSVAKLGEVFEAVEMGLLEMGISITPFEPTKMFMHNWAYSIPFFTGDARMAGRVLLKVYQDVPMLKTILEKKYNMVWVGAGGADNYGLLTKWKVRSAADVKGRKIAAAGPNLPWIKGTGAIPVQSTLNESYTSLQTGVYDGWLMFPTGNVNFKLHEIAKYYVQMDFGCATGTSAITVNKKVWKKLPKSVQDILKEVGAEYTVKFMEYAAQQEEKAVKTMKESGVDYYVMPFGEKVKWANLIHNQPKKFAKEADAKGWPGTKLMKLAIKYAEEEGHKFPRKWMEE